ncbi:MAG: HTH-type transcriptional activator IlvY [Spirochaetales bacterium]|nr:HTH-type transcriptional activator IlvY [Spirochaetales bacterium]
MDFHSLKLFLHLSNTLHFKRTSDLCYISPSALSRTIQRLEEELGQPLFIRDKRSVSLTDAGQNFKRFAQETVDRWEQFRSSLAQEELRGEIILYGSVTAAYGVLSDLFSTVRNLYPDIHLRLETGDSAQAIEKVADGSVDVAVAAKPESFPKNLLFKTLVVTPLSFIGPVVACEVTDMINSNPIPWEEVPLILAEQALSRRWVEDWFRGHGLKPHVYAEVAGHEAILSMVRLGCGVGAVPELVIDNSIFKNDVRVLDVKPRLPLYEVGLCVHRGRITSPVVRAFWMSAGE